MPSKSLLSLPFLLALITLSGCMHLKGVVLESRSGQPLRTARLNVGRPDSIANYGSHDVDSEGRFDFYVSPTDGNIMFVYDGAGAPEQTMRRLEPAELGEHMRLSVPRATVDAPPPGGAGLGAGMGFGP